jgi:hypothetical protein
MEFMIIAVTIGILAGVVALVLTAYRRDCAAMRGAVDRLELSSSVNVGRQARRAA